MTTRNYIFISLLAVCGLFFQSCTIEKRHYRNGFYVDWFAMKQQHHVVDDSVFRAPQHNARICFSEVQDTVDVPQAKHGSVQNDRPGTVIGNNDRVTVIEVVQQKIIAAPPPDEAQPPGNDKPNKKIVLLTVLGILLVGAVAFLVIPGLGAGITLLLYLAPFIGVGIYLLAKYLRIKTAEEIAAGAKGKDDVLSAHYHRFRLMLDLFFLFALVGGFFLFLGFYTDAIASGIIGAFGSVLTTGAILLTCSIAAILLVLLMFYLFRWRKDPTGYAPRRERHPRKDG